MDAEWTQQTPDGRRICADCGCFYYEEHYPHCKAELTRLIRHLAEKRKALSVMQDEVERLMEHCEMLEATCDDLAIAIGALAVATGEEQPHPGITVVEHTPDMPRVEIASNLSEYLR